MVWVNPCYCKIKIFTLKIPENITQYAENIALMFLWPRADIRQLCHAEGNRREPNGLSAVRTFDKRVAVSPTEQDFDLVVTVRTKTGQSHIAVSGTLRPELILLRLDLCITVRIFDSDIVSWQENHPPPSQNSESSSISTRTRA